MKIVRTAFSLLNTILVSINTVLIGVDALLYISFLDVQNNPKTAQTVNSFGDAFANGVGQAVGVTLVGVLFVIAEIVSLIFAAVTTTFCSIGRIRNKSVFSLIKLILAIIYLITPVILGVLAFVIN